MPPPPSLDILILGAGWSSTFLIPLLNAKNLTFAATTRDGRKVADANTIKWTFDPDEDATITNTPKNQFAPLPRADFVLITFPLTGPDQSSTLVNGYEKAHNCVRGNIRFIQLGSTGIWQTPVPQRNPHWVSQNEHWMSRKSPYDKHNARAIAEDELLKLGEGCVMNLAGLWGGERDARHWIERVAKTKADVRGKKSLHMIHGEDVARGIVAVMGKWYAARGQRWMVTDGFVYDWWALFAGWADEGNKDKDDPAREPLKQAVWVYELMLEDDVFALPRSAEALGRNYCSKDFWATFNLTPLKARI